MQFSLVRCTVVVVDVFVSPADFAKNLIVSDELERLHRRRLLLMVILVSCFYYTFDLLFVYVHLIFYSWCYYSQWCSRSQCDCHSHSQSHCQCRRRHRSRRRRRCRRRLGCSRRHYRCCTRLNYYIAYCLHRLDCLLLYKWHHVFAPLWCTHTLHLFQMIYALLDVREKRNSIKLTRTFAYRIKLVTNCNQFVAAFSYFWRWKCFFLSLRCSNSSIYCKKHPD